MNTLDELVQYCNLDNPAGALLLKGEWGCGKTYFIENTLSERVKSTHIIIRISLFGISSIAEIHHVVKSEWLSKADGLKGLAPKLNRITKVLDKFKSAIPDNTASGVAGSILSIDFTSFWKIDRKIEDKTVVLVFDDLERSNLNGIDIMGAINEYCENQKFNVIIIADEEKLMCNTKERKENAHQDMNKELSFYDIKEKVVMRTVQFEPNFNEIVNSIILDIKDQEYKDFLLSQKVSIVDLMTGRSNTQSTIPTETKELTNDYVGKEKEGKPKNNRPHNIRSLKAALQDFHRIYIMLQKYQNAESNLWLLSFIAFNMAARANMVETSDRNSYHFSCMDSLYPGCFSPSYFPTPLFDWVINGLLNEEELREYLDLHFLYDTNKPASLVKSNSIDQLDESDIEAGFAEVLQEAYEGKLSYNEYVIFIENNLLARTYELELLNVEWEKVHQALKDKAKADISERAANIEGYFQTIDPMFQAFLNEGEQEAYRLIEKARDKKRIILSENRRLYITAMKDDPVDGLFALQQKKFECFDEEMAKVTLDSYKTASNQAKRLFGYSFSVDDLLNLSTMDSEQINDTVKGLSLLYDGLTMLLESYNDQPIKKMHTKTFKEAIQIELHKFMEKANMIEE